MKQLMSILTAVTLSISSQSFAAPKFAPGPECADESKPICIGLDNWSNALCDDGNVAYCRFSSPEGETDIPVLCQDGMAYCDLNNS